MMKTFGSLAAAAVVAFALSSPVAAGGNGCNWTNCNNHNNHKNGKNINIVVDLPDDFVFGFARSTATASHTETTGDTSASSTAVGVATDDRSVTSNTSGA